MGYAAILSGAFALIIASFTLWITSPWLRLKLDDVEDELRSCRRDRTELRRRLELITGALLRTLPLSERLELLESLGDALALPDSPEAAA